MNNKRKIFDFDTTIINILVGLALWIFIGLIVGFGVSANKRGSFDVGYKTKIESGCSYKSLLSFSNPGYIIACELSRQRWDIPKDKYYNESAR